MHRGQQAVAACCPGPCLLGETLPITLLKQIAVAAPAADTPRDLPQPAQTLSLPGKYPWKQQTPTLELCCPSPLLASIPLAAEKRKPGALSDGSSPAASRAWSGFAAAPAHTGCGKLPSLLPLQRGTLALGFLMDQFCTNSLDSPRVFNCI